jgi:RNA polymerase sigma factor (TIGR02999 family)
MPGGNDPAQITRLLDAASAGEARATEELLPIVYDELRRVAGAMMAREKPGMTLQPTALVHEAYLRLLGPGGANVTWQNRRHFFSAAATAMRRILIDRARHVKSARISTTGLDTDRIELTGDFGGSEDAARPGIDTAAGAEQLLALDEAMRELAARDERQHDVVMLRYFAGLTIEQTAEALGLSAGTVKNEWTYARAWLLHRMQRGRG